MSVTELNMLLSREPQEPMSGMNQSAGARATLAAPLQTDDPLRHAEIPSSKPGLGRPLEVGEGKLNDQPFKFEISKTVNGVANLVVEAADKVTEFFSSLGIAALALVKNPKLAVAAAGITFLGAEYSAKGVMIPNGWDDSQYLALGSQCQTNLLSLRMYGTDPDTGELRYIRNLSASYLNSRFALTARHALDGFPPGLQIWAEVATGSNTATNRGIVVPVFKFIPHPDNVPGNSSTPDIMILCLARELPGPTITITNASDGEVVTHAGFGYHGTPSSQMVYDRNSRAWQAPTGAYVPSLFNSPVYRATEFYPYIPLNGKCADRDSGGPVTKANSQNSLVGINIGQGGGSAEAGVSVFIDLSHPQIRSWIETNTVVAPPNPPRLSLTADKSVRLQGDSNQIYGIEASSNLTNWQQVAEVTNLTGSVTFTETGATNFPMRFYRAVTK